jgi:hypothetical protein
MAWFRQLSSGKEEAMRSKALKFAIIMGVVCAIGIALRARTQENTSTAPPPPKPYNEAMYDVYSALLQEPELPEAARQRLLSLHLPLPQEPDGVLIRVETLTFQEPGPTQYDGLPRELAILPEDRFKPAVDSATADYVKRNTDVLELEKKFNLPHYDLFTKSEEKAFYGGEASACQKYSGYERWVELSAVGFNEDQTVAVVHFIDWRGHRCNDGTHGMLVGATFKDRMLQKRDGKWHLLPSRIFSDSTLDS